MTFKYILTLYAYNGETSTFYFNTMEDAATMRELFMITGEYTDAVVTNEGAS
jgi:hypothetical protein